MDFCLLEAWSILNDERCSQCGMPRYICHNEDNDLQWEIVEDFCGAIIAKDGYEKSMSAGKEDYRAPAGLTLRPKPVLISGGDPATVREAYYAEEVRKQRELEAEEAAVA